MSTHLEADTPPFYDTCLSSHRIQLRSKSTQLQLFDVSIKPTNRILNAFYQRSWFYFRTYLDCRCTRHARHSKRFILTTCVSKYAHRRSRSRRSRRISRDQIAVLQLLSSDLTCRHLDVAQKRRIAHRRCIGCRNSVATVCVMFTLSPLSVYDELGIFLRGHAALLCGVETSSCQ